MKTGHHFNDFVNTRAAFCKWYATTMGQMLLDLESKFLARYIRVSYKQLILQVGSLGWEDRFLDADLFRNIIVIDSMVCCHENTQKVCGEIQQIPIAAESIDFVIMPHSLEFESDQHQVLREVERVLKPEGQLLLLGFNPWSVYGLLRYLPLKRRNAPWCGKFIGRRTIIDWLRLLNFETETSAGFYMKSPSFGTDVLEGKYLSLMSLAYAVKAIKRKYTMIPLKSSVRTRRRIIAAEVVESPYQIRVNG